jgi:hypothetical protein
VTGELPEHDMTRATAHLPGLDIEITRQQSADAESISIHLRATPSFEAFGRLFEAANPFAFWAQAMQTMWMPMWSPWLNAMHAPASDVDETQRKLPRP